MSASWGTLTPGERRALLAEVRTRMARKRAEGTKAEPPKFAVERRYGRIVRKSNGAVVVETRVVRRAARPRGTVTFGFGFERRAGSAEAHAASEQQGAEDATAAGPSSSGPMDQGQIEGARLVRDN